MSNRTSRNPREMTYHYACICVRTEASGTGGEKEKGVEERRGLARWKKGKYRVFRDFLTQIISTISAKNGVHRGEREHEKTRDRNCFAVPYNLLGRGHHVSFAGIINSLFHNYYNVFAKTSMTPPARCHGDAKALANGRPLPLLE